MWDCIYPVEVYIKGNLREYQKQGLTLGESIILHSYIEFRGISEGTWAYSRGGL